MRRRRVFYTPTALPFSLVGGGRGLCRVAMAAGTMVRAGSVALPLTLMYSHPPCNKYTQNITFKSMHVQDLVLFTIELFIQLAVHSDSDLKRGHLFMTA